MQAITTLSVGSRQKKLEQVAESSSSKLLQYRTASSNKLQQQVATSATSCN
jgi:hypothetical protein